MRSFSSVPAPASLWLPEHPLVTLSGTTPYLRREFLVGDIVTFAVLNTSGASLGVYLEVGGPSVIADPAVVGAKILPIAQGTFSNLFIRIRREDERFVALRRAVTATDAYVQLWRVGHSHEDSDG